MITLQPLKESPTSNDQALPPQAIGGWELVFLWSLELGAWSFLLLCLSLATLTSPPLHAAEVPEKSVHDQVLEREPALLKEVKVPDGFEATIFAVPPSVNYPVFVSAALDGTVYVSSDRNGSLDRGANRGRVLRVRDLDGDGRADEVKPFIANVDSPRGLVWDQDRLYLLHPPNLSVYIDRDGDGIADEERVLVKNIAFTFKDRPADHSSNGIELGVDGWIYCAIGDFGFLEAEGTDGRKLQLRGGGVVRVRPDGSGLELYSHGTRNILEPCVSPLLDIFARDNTNDGDGWDTRLHHFAGLSEHGYPSLFKNFKGEFIEPLADYGGGAGCGGLFLSEPGMPDGFQDVLCTADWGRERIYRHQLKRNGATFTIDQTEFIRMPRPTDLDVDGLGHLFASSWKGATFTYVGENAGFLVRVTPKDYRPDPLPNIPTAEPKVLLGLLESPSHRRRLAAQRELLRRGLTADTTRSLKALASDKSKPLATRVVSLFALKQGLHTQAAPFLVSATRDPMLAEFAIRALCDRSEELANVPVKPLLAGLAAPDPRVRREALIALARLGKAENAGAMAKLLGDADPVVAHIAGQSLKALKDWKSSFAVIDKAAADTSEYRHAMYVLQSLHESPVVEGLSQRLAKERNEARRQAILVALCRLYSTDGIWKGDSWGTRPDTTGPYYQPAAWSETEKVGSVLGGDLGKANPDEARFLMQELARHKVQSPQMLSTVVALATKDESLRPLALTQLARAEQVPVEASLVLISATKDPNLDDSLRFQAVIALAKLPGTEAFSAMLEALSRTGKTNTAGREFQRARDAFLNSTNAGSNLASLLAESTKYRSPKSAWANAALLRLSERRNVPDEIRDAATKSLDDGWKEPARRLQILQAVVFADHRNYREKVLDAMQDPEALVAQAAQRAATALRLTNRPRTQNATRTIDKMPVELAIAAAVENKGDVKQGEELFTKLGCINCHTTAASQPLKGPFLGTIANTYKRRELAESVLLPSKTIAQGFASNHFELKDGTEYDGFVTQEAASSVTIRTITAQEIQIRTTDVVKRVRMEKSLMPEGLAAGLSIKEFASILDYLESLPAKQ